MWWYVAGAGYALGVVAKAHAAGRGYGAAALLSDALALALWPVFLGWHYARVGQ